MKIKTIASSSAGCAYAIESGGEILLIECGVTVKKIRQALNFDLSKVVGCVVSHEHGDHAKYLPELEKAGWGSWCTQGTRKKFNLLNSVRMGKGHSLICGTNFKCTPIELEHDCECYGFIIDAGGHRLGYFTDTGQVNFKVPGITKLMIEMNYSFESLLNSQNKYLAGRIADNHLSDDDVSDFVRRHKSLQEIHLIHLSDRNSDEELFKRKIQEISGVPVFVAKKE